MQYKLPKFLILLFFPLFLQAQIPSLDPGFGDNGTVDLPSEALEIAVQADKKILSLSNNSLSRFLPDGEIDANFGDNGQVALPFDFSDVSFYFRANHPLHSQPDNKTIVIYRTSLFRYNEDGSPDTGFGENGTVDISNYTTAHVEWVNDLLILPDGKMIVAATTGMEPMYAANAVGLNPDGSLNSEFANLGWFTALDRSVANNIAAQPDGNVIISGRAGFDASEWITIFRISPDGQPDASFNTVHLNPINQFEPAADMVILKDGRILVGSSHNTGVYESHPNLFQLIMLDQDGNLDHNFGAEGKIIYDDIEMTSFEHWHDFIQSMILLPDDRVLVSLYERSDILAFDIDGHIIDDFQGIKGNTLALQEEEKLIIGDGGVLGRYLLREPAPEPTFPTPDLSFGENGAVDIPMDREFVINTQPDQKILALNNNLLLRLLPDGDIDTGFGQDGSIELPAGFSIATSIPHNIFFQEGNKILILSSANEVLRLNEDGSIDNSFGDNGILHLDEIIGETVIPRDLIIDNEGNLFVAGSVASQVQPGIGPHYDFILFKFDKNGGLDTGFGESGYRIVPFTGMLTRMAFHHDGDIILLGNAGFEIFRIAIAKIGGNGQIDESFGNGETTIEPISQSELGNGMAITNDGKILISSSYDEDPLEGSVYLQLIRLNPDGSLDNGFGENGRILYEDLPGADESITKQLHDGSLAVLFYESGGLHAFNSDGSRKNIFQGLFGYTFALQGNNKVLLGSLEGTIRRYLISEPEPAPPVSYPNTDPSFDGDGIVAIPGFSPGYLTVQEDKKILLSGVFINEGGAIIRLLENGDFDNSFGEGGILRGISGIIEVQEDGKIVVGTNTRQGIFENVSTEIRIRRLNPDGSIDSDFGENGVVYLNNAIPVEEGEGYFGVNNLGGLAVYNGKIIIAGSASIPTPVPYMHPSTFAFSIFMLNSDGTPDVSFDNDGSLLLPIEPESHFPIDAYTHDIKVQPDEKIVILGQGVMDPEQFRKIAMARINFDGSIDTSFNNGKLLLQETEVIEGAGHSFVIQEDGKYIIGAYYFITIDYAYLLRVNQDGSIDDSFNVDNDADILRRDQNYPHLQIQSDGKVIMAGNVLTRFGQDGSLDETFMQNGYIELEQEFRLNGGAIVGLGKARGLKLQQDEKILVINYVYDESGAGVGQVIRFLNEVEGAPDTPEVTRLTFINAQTNEELFEIEDGQVINLQEIGTNEINIRAYTDPEPTGSVRFILTGPHNRTHIENVSYYALFANDGENFFSWQPPLGDYQLTATPYTKSGTQGEEGTALTVSFSIIDEEVAPVKVEMLTLINAQTNEELFEIEDGQVINLQEIGTNEINIRAYTDPEPTGSVRFVLTGPHNRTHVENVSYYALFANDGDNFFSWKPPLGDYQLTATPYSERGAQGEAGTALTVSFSIIDEEIAPVRVERLTLINASTNQELFEIKDGQVINLQEIGTNEINIRAYTDPEPTGSVRFVLTGPRNRTHIENVSYYALFANDGDSFFSWIPPLGHYNLNVTPFTEIRAQGEEGTSLAISFSIVSESPEAQRVADVFPNPGTSTLFIPLESQRPIKVLMFDLAGKQVMDKVSLSHYDDRVEINVNGLESKAYIIQLVSDKETRNIRWMKE